ncbi:MAG: PAS domain S-box protein [Candidatus Abyssobacteria bacterium SURF_5]|uniref:protein-glutamate O-methyltransferase n=1 Tax=Abyssobacteria bacterium (strain SURF_5) TaxID=2093360 RepID=A0A3A4ND34_ABYX5|nr:MAG: PAS domain S-box protein [Candidatus Abyssubacteria bacterium SURF_5]
MIEDKHAFEELLNFLKFSRNFDFTGYKRSSLTRRIQKRMATVKTYSYEEYQDYLEVHPEEFNELFNTILINVTCFFRDPVAWEFLANEAVPALLEKKGEQAQVRAWSVGCSTGQEAYTLAMILAEVLGKERFIHRAKIYATDADQEAIIFARHGLYSKQDLEEVPERLHNKYFRLVNGKYQFDKELRRNVIFGAHDVVQAAPISRLDILACRNTMMYFNIETQEKILGRFHFALNDYGILFLGMAETMLTRDRFFEPLNQKLRIFRKLPMPVSYRRAIAAGNLVEPVEEPAARQQLYESLFQFMPAAQLVVDTDEKLLLANLGAVSLFNIKESDVGRPFFELEVSYRPAELRPLIHDVLNQNRVINLTGVERNLPEGAVQYLDIYMYPLADQQRKIVGVGIFFTDVTAHRQLQKEAERINVELEQALVEVQSSSEELETTNEELQSTVEELETSNEELQSSNEEMETMNEELQATNEELQTINDELRERTEQLNQMTSFRDSVLRSVPMGVVALDRRFQVMMWNLHSEQLWGIRADEAETHNFLNLDMGLPVEKLKDCIRTVLENKEAEKVELKAINRRGKEVTVHVNCSPLIGREREAAGVILVMDEYPKKG